MHILLEHLMVVARMEQMTYLLVLLFIPPL